MKHHLIGIVIALGFSLGTLSTLEAAEPRLEKAIQLLKQAQDSSEPVPLLEKAQEHLENATGNKGGFKVDAIKIIKNAIKSAQKGENVKEQISQAIALVQAGVDAQ